MSDGLPEETVTVSETVTETVQVPAQTVPLETGVIEATGDIADNTKTVKDPNSIYLDDLDARRLERVQNPPEGSPDDLPVRSGETVEPGGTLVAPPTGETTDNADNPDASPPAQAVPLSDPNAPLTPGGVTSTGDVIQSPVTQHVEGQGVIAGATAPTPTLNEDGTTAAVSETPLPPEPAPVADGLPTESAVSVETAPGEPTILTPPEKEPEQPPAHPSEIIAAEQAQQQVQQ